jgi:hypothetical protein
MGILRVKEAAEVSCKQAIVPFKETFGRRKGKNSGGGFGRPCRIILPPKKQ